jgi:hypothetical protein
MSGPGLRKEVERLLAAGALGTEVPDRAAEVADPVAVHAPDGTPAGWIVGLTVGERLAGFAQFDQEARMLRYASFQRRPGSLDGCPRRDVWLAGDQARARARDATRPGETLGVPFLSFDAHPSRLVWIVPAASAAGATDDLYVAGDVLYRKPRPAGGPRDLANEP